MGGFIVLLTDILDHKATKKHFQRVHSTEIVNIFLKDSSTTCETNNCIYFEGRVASDPNRQADV